MLKATAVDFMELTDCVQGGCFFISVLFNLTTSLKGYSPKNDFYSIKNTHVHETWHVSIDIKGQHDKLTVWFFIYVFI